MCRDRKSVKVSSWRLEGYGIAQRRFRRLAESTSTRSSVREEERVVAREHGQGQGQVLQSAAEGGRRS